MSISRKHVRPRAAAIILGGAAATALIVAGCGGDGRQTGGFRRPPTAVETAPVVQGPVQEIFSIVGTIEAGESITVTSEIDGIVVALPFREGGRLRQGELIAGLDDRQLRAEADRARALRDQGRSTWERVRTVVEAGAGSPQDLDDAVAALKVAEANLALAETRLDKASITAPFSGMVGARRVSPGAFVRAGEPITDLAKIDQLRVNFSVPERLLASMRQGSGVTLRTTAFADLILQGAIDVIEPQLDPLTRNARVVARVANPEGLLRPGMSATVEVELSRREDALTVPSEAVFVEGGQEFVYVVKPDSVVARVPVDVGTRQPATVEISTGLTAGQVVVRAGHQKLYEGAKVMPVTAGAPGPGGAR